MWPAGAVLDLGGSAETMGGLSGDGPGDQLRRGHVVLNVAGGGTFSGVLSNTLALTKSAGGTLTLGGVNTYSGPTKVTGGRDVGPGRQRGLARRSRR